MERLLVDGIPKRELKGVEVVEPQTRVPRNGIPKRELKVVYVALSLSSSLPRIPKRELKGSV